MTTRTETGKFAKGNPGRPKGAKHVTTRAIEELMQGEAKAITRKAIQMAKAGDATAMRLCLERIFPLRKGRPVPFALPSVEGVKDIPEAGAAILRAVADGTLSPDEASAIMGVVSAYRQSVEASEIVARLEKLEAANAQ